MKIRIATYNVHKCKGLDGRVSVKRIAEVLSELDADVVALQEIFGIQAEYLARRCACTPRSGRTVSCWAMRMAILFSAGTRSGRTAISM